MTILFEFPDIKEEIKKESEKLLKLNPIEEIDSFKQSMNKLSYLYKVKEEYEQTFINKLYDVAIIKATICDINNENGITKGKLYFNDGNVLSSQKVILNVPDKHKGFNLYIFETPLVTFHINEDILNKKFYACCYLTKIGTSFNTGERLIHEDGKNVRCFYDLNSICSDDED